MRPLRELPLYDPGRRRGTWNERMTAGEFAVHYSTFAGRTTFSEPYCSIFPSLEDAVKYSEAEVRVQPELRCTIYGHEGFAGPPVQDVRGALYQEKDGFSPRYRRWVGSVLFFGGSIMFAADWINDFSLSWPAMIGTRIILPGLALLVAEAVIVFEARRKRT
jgi:hypothetical protein